MSNTSIQISKEVHKELKLLAVKTDKKLYELISESLILLKDKYNE
jgi:mRNA-degrading endonuclease RelE of RelBE toxin-antitoxin system